MTGRINRPGFVALLCMRLVLGGTMLWAGWEKIPEPIFFVQTVHAYDILPEALATPFAVVVPWIELVIGLALIVGLWTRESALVSGVMLGSFGVAIGINILRGAEIDCGCFGAEGGRDSLHMALLQDLLLLAAALALLIYRQGMSWARPFSQGWRQPRRAGATPEVLEK